MSTRRANYKQKWLDAISEKGGSPQNSLKTFKNEVDTLNQFQVNTSLQWDRLKHPMLEAARNAANVLSTMDEFSTCGSIEFVETCLPIDKKLGDMDLVTIARRLRDTLKLAEARIGILSVALSETEATTKEYMTELDTMKQFMLRSGEKMTELLVVGASPTKSEHADANEALIEGREFHRYNLEYEDHDNDEWDMLRLTKDSVLRTRRATDEDTDENDDSGEDSEDDTDNTHVALRSHKRNDSALAISHAKNRSAQVIGADALTL